MYVFMHTSCNIHILYTVQGHAVMHIHMHMDKRRQWYVRGAQEVHMCSKHSDRPGPGRVDVAHGSAWAIGLDQISRVESEEGG